MRRQQEEVHSDLDGQKLLGVNNCRSMTQTKITERDTGALSAIDDGKKQALTEAEKRHTPFAPGR